MSRPNYSLSTGKMMTCARCGKEIVRNCPTQRYCTTCSSAVKAERGRKNKTDKRVGEVMTCEVCGKEIIRKSARQKYCVTCSSEVQRKQIREHDLKRRQRSCESAR